MVRRNRFRALLLGVAATVMGTTAFAGAAQAAPLHFVNQAQISMFNEGPANTYPSTINVAGQSGTVSKATVTVAGIFDSWRDVNALLVGPGGQNVLLMAFACQGGVNQGTSFTFDDSAGSQLSKDGACIAAGSFKPSNFDGSPEALTAPAPALPYGAALSVFNGTNPNGDWKLFLDNVGITTTDPSLEAGWSLDLEIAPPPPVPPPVDTKKCPKGKKLKTVKKNGKKKKRCVKKKKSKK